MCGLPRTSIKVLLKLPLIYHQSLKIQAKFSAYYFFIKKSPDFAPEIGER
jgi:hypothetical protein